MKRFFALCLLLGGISIAQVPVSPIVQPRVTFVDAYGAPCAGCSLYSYAAGTTTALATYTDAAGTSQNQNPIILDAAGGANIWLGANSYKLILKDTVGTTLWTVDQVNSARLFPCASAGSIQVANSSKNALTCDPNITVNTLTHTINIGTLGSNYVTIGALGTPTSWTLDTTSPATAAASVGAMTDGSGATSANQLALSTSSAHVLGYSSTLPNGTMATTQAANDRSNKVATTEYAAYPGTINPDSIFLNGGSYVNDNQGNGVKLQHSTGTTTTNDCTKFDGNGNTVDAGFVCNPPALFATTNDRTGSRVLSAAYQNTGTTPMYVSGYAAIGGGSGDSTLTFLVGPSSPSITCDSNTTTATISGEHVSFSCMVPAGSFYEITATNLITSIGRWIETQ